jgi:hypothetical protein
VSEPKLSGDVIIGEMTSSVLLPCGFTVYLKSRDHATPCGVFNVAGK